ncbi:MAG: hypothetical protein JRF72_08430 [Deltaproteobacteria bacterium]|jgi:anaerobic selenocysteine-containing dehydrogenase|nr:hypothetical protein [Deltaproteobacteria bacterium]
MADWEILDLLIARMMQIDGYGDLEKIRTEIRKNIAAYADLDGTQTSWVKQIGRMALFNPENSDGLIQFYPVVTCEDEDENKEFPYSAIIGSLRYHLGSGTRTAASQRIRDFDSIGALEIAPEDGATLGLANGDRIKITSLYGELESAVRLREEIRPGELFVPMAINSNEAMNLINLADLADPKSDGWKSVRVKLEKI